MVDKKLFDENGKLKPVARLPWKKRAKDWWIKGFQLSRCYLDHWDEIKDIFEFYDVDLNRQGPIITVQTLKYVRLAKELTEKIKTNKEIRRLAKNSNFTLRTVYYDGTDKRKFDEEKFIDGTIFVVLLRVIPQFCMSYGLDKMFSFVENGNSKQHFKSLFSIEGGTIIDTENNVEEIVRNMVKEAIEEHE